MKCAVHGEVDATGFCRNCGKAMCAACVRPVRDVYYCEDCLAQVMGIPAPPVMPPAGTAVGVAGTVPPVALPPLAPGSYHLRWRALSRDGHGVPGEIRFSITP